MEKSLIHSNELHFISKKRIHQAVEKMVESLTFYFVRIVLGMVLR